MNRPREEPNMNPTGRINHPKKEHGNPTKSLQRKRIKACGEDIPLALQYLIGDGIHARLASNLKQVVNQLSDGSKGGI